MAITPAMHAAIFVILNDDKMGLGIGTVTMYVVSMCPWNRYGHPGTGGGAL